MSEPHHWTADSDTAQRIIDQRAQKQILTSVVSYVFVTTPHSNASPLSAVKINDRLLYPHHNHRIPHSPCSACAAPTSLTRVVSLLLSIHD
jgi:hypothetical protein